jgi:hypothetical protein
MLGLLNRHGRVSTREAAKMLWWYDRDYGSLDSDRAGRALNRLKMAGLVARDGDTGAWSLTSDGRCVLT